VSSCWVDCITVLLLTPVDWLTNVFNSLLIASNGISCSWAHCCIKVSKLFNNLNINNYSIKHKIPLKYEISEKCLLEIKDKNVLISGSGDYTIRIWNIINDYKQIKILNDHRGSVNTLAVYKNKRVLSGSDDETIIVWKLDNFEKD